jgi:dephospho-CoA kinase
MERNAVSYDEVIKRMDKQVDEKIKMKLCDFVIYNDEHQLLIPQVIELHEKLTEISKERQTNRVKQV